MGFAVSADLLLLQLIVILHIMTVLLFAFDITVVFDKSYSARTKFGIDISTIAVVFFIAHILQQLIGKLQDHTAGAASSDMTMGFLLSTQIEMITIVSAIAVMALTSIRLYFNSRNHYVDEGKRIEA